MTSFDLRQSSGSCIGPVVGATTCPSQHLSPIPIAPLPLSSRRCLDFSLVLPTMRYHSTSSGRLERDLRRREHDALLALLRDENIIAASDQSVQARMRRKEARLRAGGSRRESGVSGAAATAAGGVGDVSAGGRHYSFCGDKEDEEGEVGSGNEDDHLGTSSPLKTPLTPEAWRNVLTALERSLRLVRGAGRAEKEEEGQRRPRRRRQTAAAAGPDTSSATNDGCRSGHRQASPSTAPRPGSGSLSPEPPSPRSRSSSRSVGRNGRDVLDPAGGDEDRCHSPPCDSRPPPRSVGSSPRKAYGGRRCERSEVEGVSLEPPGGAGRIASLIFSTERIYPVFASPAPAATYPCTAREP